MNTFNNFINGRNFTFQIDHGPLLAICGLKKGTPNRLQRCGTILLNYFTMEHQLCKKLRPTNGLSRLIPKNAEPFEDTDTAALKSEIKIKKKQNILCNVVTNNARRNKRKSGK